ncbi:MAG TPA: hypothetical protein VHY20_10775 [Pirellulales bacterium]|jgi:hypothetical protein|nr:hypothetical protein [Pirellulales bacterium]
MPTALAAATLIFSVDVDAGYPASDLAGLRQVDLAAGRLMDIFRRRQLRATWGLGQLAASSLARRLVDAGHEVGVLGELAWAGTGISRSRYSAELGRRVAALVESGGRVTTLLMHQGVADVPLDLLARHGIRAVRPAPASAPRASLWRKLLGGWKRSAVGEPPMRCLRHGIWELAAGQSQPTGVSRRSLRRLARAAFNPFPLTIDVSRLASGGEENWSAVERVVQHAEQLREREQVQIETVAAWLGGVSQTPLRRPARSILRRAA